MHGSKLIFTDNFNLFWQQWKCYRMDRVYFNRVRLCRLTTNLTYGLLRPTMLLVFWRPARSEKRRSFSSTQHNKHNTMDHSQFYPPSTPLRDRWRMQIKGIDELFHCGNKSSCLSKQSKESLPVHSTPGNAGILDQTGPRLLTHHLSLRLPLHSVRSRSNIYHPCFNQRQKEQNVLNSHRVCLIQLQLCVKPQTLIDNDFPKPWRSWHTLLQYHILLISIHPLCIIFLRVMRGLEYC